MVWNGSDENLIEWEWLSFLCYFSRLAQKDKKMDESDFRAALLDTVPS